MFVAFGATIFTFSEGDGVGVVKLLKTEVSSFPFDILVSGGGQADPVPSHSMSLYFLCTESSQTDVIASVSPVSWILSFEAGVSAPNVTNVDCMIIDDEVGLEDLEVVNLSLTVLMPQELQQTQFVTSHFHLGNATVTVWDNDGEHAVIYDLYVLSTQSLCIVNTIVSVEVTVELMENNCTVSEGSGSVAICIRKDRETIKKLSIDLHTDYLASTARGMFMQYCLSNM